MSILLIVLYLRQELSIPPRQRRTLCSRSSSVNTSAIGICDLLTARALRLNWYGHPHCYCARRPAVIRCWKTALKGIVATALLLPVPVYAWSFTGSWFVADQTTPVNATFSSSGKTVSIIYTGTPGSGSSVSDPISITLWRTVATTGGSDPITAAFNDNNVNLTGSGTTFTVDAQLGNLSGSIGSRTFTGTSFSGFPPSPAFSGNAPHTVPTSSNQFVGTVTNNVVQVTLTITPSGNTYKIQGSTPYTVGTFTFGP